MTQRPIRRALISVYDKTGLTDLAHGLHKAGVSLVSTGSTAKQIADAGVPVTKVEELTGFPECLEGRVKTLHPRVHAGILADTRKADHLDQLRQLDIEPFDLVVCNLYPFADTVGSGASVDECVEQIDIGGPSMVRAAAKNHPSVAIVVSPDQYDKLLTAVEVGGFTLDERKQLALEAFTHTARYDIAVASWMSSVLAPDLGGNGFPRWVGASWERGAVLRYGENPHQRAAIYLQQHGVPALAQAEQLHGKQMSYNNYLDSDAARRAAYDHVDPCVAIIKHTNPCGIAISADIAGAYQGAFDCDPVSAFGGVVATNRPVTSAMAARMADVFVEVVVAPDFDDEALELLREKKNVRLLRCAGIHPGEFVEMQPVSGGLLLQSVDDVEAEGDTPSAWELAAGAASDPATLRDLEFAWRASRSVKSNAILLAKSGASVGVGMGQVSRVDSARLAVLRAGEDRARGSVAASDAFFPFPDGLQVLVDAGIKAVVQPGGSMRDDEVKQLAEAAGITMYFTNTRHFYH